MFSEKIDPHLKSIETALDGNVEYKAASKDTNVQFNVKVAGKESHITVDIVNGGTRVYSYSSSDPAFEISARQEQWERFFEPIPKPPYQSFWGMLRTLGPEQGVQVLGDTTTFAKHARIWRLFLDQLRITANNAKPVREPASDVEPEEFITGRYIHTTTALYGRARVFIESAGTGPQQLLLLHTAGSDSRQQHAFMNTPSLQPRFTMHAFDLPGHGRSDFGTNQTVGALSLDEATYISLIDQVIRTLRLSNVIVCGASMAGQICLAVALRAAELGVAGVVACEACAHIPHNPRIYDLQGADEGVLNPETVCGMMSPTSPERYQRQVWWGYSSQGIGVFKGDLKFYFQGWDGRGRLGGISCPVYMLTGEYDYSCNPEMSRRTFEEIQMGEGKHRAAFEVMEGMGHFPISEDPEKFLGYFERAVEFIQAKRD